jgi:hypothetical protein
MALYLSHAFSTEVHFKDGFFIIRQFDGQDECGMVALTPDQFDMILNSKDLILKEDDED